jgi:hypothetical protein
MWSRASRRVPWYNPDKDLITGCDAPSDLLFKLVERTPIHTRRLREDISRAGAALSAKVLP